MKKFFLSLFLLTSVLFSACDLNAPLRNKMVDYYSDNEVYYDLYGIVTSMRYHKPTKETIVEIDILTQNHAFKLNTETGWYEFVIADYTGEDDKLSVGDQIEFISAPMCFYNGHFLPIVALKMGDEVLLEFEDGKNNYIAWINETFG